MKCLRSNIPRLRAEWQVKGENHSTSLLFFGGNGKNPLVRLI